MRERAPNILFIMADQMAPQALPAYGHGLVKAPNITRLAEGGVVFENAYCNSPLCAPARFSMLAGQLPSRIGAYDNSAEFPASVPTFLHHLRAGGYRTCLSGKMHFVGPDQLHGFEERLTTDVYPADFGWTPNWEHPETRYSWFHTMESVAEAGVYRRTLEYDYDEEVAYHSVQKIYDLARDADERPFCLTVSFIQPHDPYMITPEYWDRYDHGAVDLPRIAAIPLAERDPHSRRLYELYDRGEYEVTEENVRNARHAYYAMISYIDEQVGGLLQALADTGLDDDTVVVFTSDHGDMLGERGLWYKMCFFEWAARVPLIVTAPRRIAPGRVAASVSHVDLFPTLLEIAAGAAAAGAAAAGPVEPVDGQSLVPLLDGSENGWPDTVFGEYLAEGTVAPCFMIKRGRHKYVSCPGDPPQLYDLAADPDELQNLAGQPRYAETAQAFAAEVDARWDAAAIRRQVVASQRRRRFVFEALRHGRVTAWDFQPHRDASRRYSRNDEDLYDTDRRARIPHRPA